MTSTLAALPDYAPVPQTSPGPAVSNQGYCVGQVERNLYWITDGDYNSAFLTTRDGVVLFDAPPTIGHNIQRVEEIAAATGVSNTVTHLVHTHHLSIRPRRRAAPPQLNTPQLSPEELADPVRSYIQIKPDGTVLVIWSQLEMGRGAHTGLATIVAEELDAEFDSIQVVDAANGVTPNGDVYGNFVGGGFQITGASSAAISTTARLQ
jgi:Molybdopterin-binding domain of aldehyde dehydrogenase